MFRIEVDVYSGMPNPEFTLSTADAKELRTRILDGVASIVPVHEGPQDLGYRGIIVRADAQEAAFLRRTRLPSAFRIVGDDRPAGSPLPTFGTEAFLVDRSLTAAEREQTSEETMPQDPVGLMAAAAACSLYYTSWNDFSFWNGDRIDKNNCYNYAANYASNTGRAMPGKQGGYNWGAPVTMAKVKTGLDRDGWVEGCSGGNMFVALVIFPASQDIYGTGDFHFYRKNLNDSGANRWCHKPGHTAARNKDFSGNFITNPQNCDRGVYTNWGGIFYSNGVRSRTVQ